MSGASAGGINAVFLAQAVHSGQSLEPLTDLWLEVADVDELVDPAARLKWRFSKLWAQPFANWLLSRPGSDIADAVAPETRAEVRTQGFAPHPRTLVRTALFRDRLSRACSNAPSRPWQGPDRGTAAAANHPLDLYVTATDFHGYQELLRLHSPPVVEDTEHRMPISFRAHADAGRNRSRQSARACLRRGRRPVSRARFRRCGSRKSIACPI